MSVAWADMDAEDRKEVTRLLRKSARLERQFHLKKFAALHDLACFSCGSSMNDWAKTGTTNGRHWAICQPCIWRPR